MNKSANRLIVADAGPLIALVRIDAVDLLERLFDQALLTPQVLAECEARPDRGEGAVVRSAINAGRLQLRAVSTPPPAWSVDAGEASAIALALELQAGVLMDDRAGRRVATRLGVNVLGTAGLLVLAKRRGKVTAVAPLLEALVASGYFISDDVRAQALALADEPG